MRFNLIASITNLIQITFCNLFLFFWQGYGTHFYSETEHYEGEWYADKRSGWGRIYYADGSIYEGEWYDDQRSGQGMHRLSMSIISLYVLTILVLHHVHVILF